MLVRSNTVLRRLESVVRVLDNALHALKVDNVMVLNGQLCDGCNVCTGA